LGTATIWPVIYMALFFLTIFSFVFLLSFEEDRSSRNSKSIDLIQLERKIKNGDLKQLTVRPSEIVAIDRVGNREYHTEVTSDSTREEILREAREVDANGQPRVAKIEEESVRPVSPLFPIGFAALFAVHIFTIFLIMGMMPLYIILAVKSDRIDQNMKIVWAILICMVGMFAMPVYWYLYIWRKPPVRPASGSALPGDESSATA
jgi:hypothetical protein